MTTLTHDYPDITYRPTYAEQQSRKERLRHLFDVCGAVKVDMGGPAPERWIELTEEDVMAIFSVLDDAVGPK